MTVLWLMILIFLVVLLIGLLGFVLVLFVLQRFFSVKQNAPIEK